MNEKSLRVLEFNKIKDKNKTFKDPINLVKKLLENVYRDSFKLYPYDRFINNYRKSQNIKTYWLPNKNWAQLPHK